MVNVLTFKRLDACFAEETLKATLNFDALGFDFFDATYPVDWGWKQITMFIPLSERFEQVMGALYLILKANQPHQQNFQ